MTHTLQDDTESNLAREAHKISAGRMRALFVMILQVQGHVIRTRITTDLMAVMISPKPLIGANPFGVAQYKNPLVHCERCSPVVQPARRHTSNIQTTALINNFLTSGLISRISLCVSTTSSAQWPDLPYEIQDL